MEYDDIVVGVEANGVDTGSVAGVLADVLALNDVGEDDVLVSAAGDELGVVLADVERVNVVVVDVPVLLDHQVSPRVVQAHAAVL